MPPRKKAAEPAPPAPPEPLPPLNEHSIIVATDLMFPIGDLVPFHRNPNKGDVDLIEESIEVNGFFDRVLANVGTLTGRPNEILAGNHRWLADRKAGATHIPVDFVDVDEQRAIKIVEIANGAAKRSKIDRDILADLLSGLDDLSGTSVSDDELAKMLGGGDEDVDTSPQLDAAFAVVIDCEDETVQAHLLGEFEERGLSARPLMM
jgi:ParB-like chromosome segregation protein Spo0J